MSASNPRSTVRLCGLPIHAMLVPVPLFCFLATLVTDLVYWRTAAMMWANMSAWLLTVGLLASIVAAAVGIIDLTGDRRIRQYRAAWFHAIGNGVVLVLSIVNWLVHSRDAYTSVVPSGLILSALVALLLLITSWNGWSMVYRHGVGAAQQEHV